MSKKQLIGFVAAVLAFVFVGVSSALTNMVTKSFSNTGTADDALGSVVNTSNKIELPQSDFIGVVKVQGAITQNTSTSVWGVDPNAYNHSRTLQYIDEMMNSDTNKGILLYVNSPGGGVYESDQLYLKLKEYKEKTNRPIWTYMASQACSGGYYISMASDKICANRNVMTGSIGVIMSFTNMKGLYDKLGIKEVDITSGPNKAMGSAGLDMTDEQRAILQSMVDEAYEQFVGIVAEGRGMDVEVVKPIADGRIYTAKQALNLGLIDEIKNYDEMEKEYQDSIGNDVEFYELPSEDNTLAMLFSKVEKLKTKSDAQVLSEYLESKENGGLMYYAKQQ